ncbi:MAG: RdgB/HAM1 family non-canonical purine NTP pyrophosphatase [Robiginitomaculum sp.]
MTAPFTKIVVASHNQGKIREIRELLAPFGIETVSAGELGLADVEETGTTFAANAELKARYAAKMSGLPSLSDDSGLAVDSLDGAPGIYSARWTQDEGGNRDWALGMQRVRDAMRQDADGVKTARFICALTLAIADGDTFKTHTYLGKVEGKITWPPRGDMGFGYDPIFQPLGHDISFGQMAPAEKHAMSHRADAFKQLIAAQFK